MNSLSRMRLISIEVEGLFGIYNHTIDLNVDDRITLLYGPNGVGKTSTLKMINSLIQKNTAYFRQLPFRRFKLTFDGGYIELIKNFDDESSRLILKTNDVSEDEVITLGVSAEQIAKRLRFLRKEEEFPDVWFDIQDDEFLTDWEVESKYGSEATKSSASGIEQLSWFNNFLEHTGTYFIQAQRLVRVQSNRSMRRRRFSSRSINPSMSAVAERNLLFLDRLQNTTSQYARKAQYLDQTFPRRLVKFDEPFDDESLKKRMAKLEETTERLKQLGLLRREGLISPDFSADLDSRDVRVLTLWVQDTEEKLNELEELAKRVENLLHCVNNNFRNKKLRVDSEKGLVAETSHGEELPLDFLSSGEQHKFVIHVDLLFKVPKNTILLVDEPEISLHIAWQKQFLPELMEVVKLASFDAIIATHSPYIVNENWELLKSLK